MSGLSIPVLAAVAALIGVSAPAAAAPEATCRLARFAELPVIMDGPQPLVSVKINGQDVLMLVDSGAFFSALAEPFVLAQGGAIRQLPRARIAGADGSTAFRHTEMRELEIGGAKVAGPDFLVIPRAPGRRSVGVLGQNLLGAADVEYDLANRAIRLFQPMGDCVKGSRAYWNPPSVQVASFRPVTAAKPHIYLDVEINGVKLRAMMDTGASASIISLKAAARAGVTPTSPGAVPTSASVGVAGRNVATWEAPIAKVAIGDEVISNTRIKIADLAFAEADMLLGADFFLSHRVYVARSQRRLYFSYNGGPVFRLDGA